MKTFCLPWILLLACSAPAQIRDLQDAENHEKAGRYEAALVSYEDAMKSCRKIGNARRRQASCSSAHLEHAELLVTMGRVREAIAAYRDAESILAKDRPAAAQACYAVGLLYFKLGELENAYRNLWRTITDYPQEAFAADAVKRLLRDGRERSPAALKRELQKLSGSLADRAIADNLLFALADLEEHEFDNPKAALANYDRIVDRYRHSGFKDDSLWHGARISRALGDPEGAVKRLRKLLSTREVAIGLGSYFSVWLDDSQLELGRTLRDDLQKYDEAVRAFSRLPKDYPASILRDDALYEKAVTHAKMSQPDKACKDLSKLKSKYPDSKYEIEKAPQLSNELGCSG